MYHKNLDVFIQFRFSKHFFINEFNSAGCWNGFFGGIASPGQFSLAELHVSITESQEKHAKNYFYADISQ